MPPITFAIIGTNWITDSWISAAHKSGQWQLSAVYSRTQESAGKFGRKHDCNRLFTSLDELAADPESQAVYIASPNSLHYEQTQIFLRAKKHVILEKPAASNPEDLESLFALAKENDVFLIEAFRHIQEANYKLLHRLIHDDHRLGPIYGASFQYATFSSRYNNVLKGETPNIFSLELGGGSLVDVGVYPITFAVGLFGAPKAQRYVPFISRTGADGGGVIILEYDTFGVQINQSKCYYSKAPCEVYGEKGTLIINAAFGISSIVHVESSTKQEKELAGPCVVPEESFVNMLEESVEFARIINEKDSAASARLEEISRIVVRITTDLRRQNDILYPSDK